MGLSRSGTLFLIGLLVLIALSLHPVPRVESVIDAAFAPSRLLAELVAPLRWLGSASVSAAESEAASALGAERERSHALLRASQAAAFPADPALRANRAAIGAHVIGHDPRNPDRLRLCFAIDAHVVPGSPLVCGDVFVGRVVSLDPRSPGEALAELVTARDFRVSAEVAMADRTGARFVVGGVLARASSADRDLHLAAQFPSDRDTATGTVRVREIDGSREARLADGFLLGELCAVDVRGTRLLGVRPALDYAFGLSHVAVLVAPEHGPAGDPLPIDPFEASSWLATRVLLAGDPSALRETRRVTLTTRSGILPGAAVALGARLLGRVERVGPLDADVRLLGDPGLAFSALARIEGRAAPLALGRLVSLGGDGEGGVAFECNANVPLGLTEGGSVEVELWTAAAEPDVPPGLLIGTARLESGERPFTLSVRPAADARGAHHLNAWRGRGAPQEGGP